MRWRGPTTPEGPEPLWFGLFPSRSPLLGDSLLFSLPPGTKMFQFPGFASPTKLRRWPVCNRPGCPIRKSADQWPFAPTRGLSQLVTSFIACESLGIRRTPFLAFSYLRLPVKAASVFLLEYTLGSTLRHVCFHTHKKNDALNIYVFVSLRFAFAYSMSKNAWSRSKRTGAESRGLEPQSGAGSPHSFVPYIDSTDSMG